MCDFHGLSLDVSDKKALVTQANEAVTLGCARCLAAIVARGWQVLGLDVLASDPVHCRRSLLIRATLNNNLKACQLLVEARADVGTRSFNSRGQIALNSLEIACIHGNFQVYQYLVSVAGHRGPEWWRCALEQCCVGLLLDLSPHSPTPGRHREIIEQFLASGAVSSPLGVGCCVYAAYHIHTNLKTALAPLQGASAWFLPLLARVAGGDDGGPFEAVERDCLSRVLVQEAQAVLASLDSARRSACVAALGPWLVVGVRELVAEYVQHEASLPTDRLRKYISDNWYR